jgi:hypothetical protein
LTFFREECKISKCPKTPTHKYLHQNSFCGRCPASAPELCRVFKSERPRQFSPGIISRPGNLPKMFPNILDKNAYKGFWTRFLQSEFLRRARQDCVPSVVNTEAAFEKMSFLTSPADDTWHRGIHPGMYLAALF